MSETPAAEIAKKTESSFVAKMKKVQKSQDFRDFSGMVQVLGRVPVRYPHKQEWFRTNQGDDNLFPQIFLVEDMLSDADDKLYLVDPEVEAELADISKPYTLFHCVTKQKVNLIVPVRIQTEADKNTTAMKTLRDCIIAGVDQWTKREWNTGTGAHDYMHPTANYGEPEFSAEQIAVLMETGFKGRIISDDQHPLVKSLRGTG